MLRVFIIAMNELRILSRDRQAMALLFVMPMALILFITLALQNVYHSKIDHDVKLAILTEDTCHENLCAHLIDELKSHQFATTIYPSRNDLPNSTEMALVLPRRLEVLFTKLLKGEAFSDEDRLELLSDPALDQSSRQLVRAQVSLAFQSMLIREVQIELKNRGIDFKALSRSLDLNELVQERPINGLILPNPIQQTVPAWILFGMFFIAIPLGNSIFRDRESGVFKRLLTFPVTRIELIAGKILPFTIINLLQFYIMFVMGMFILPVLTHLPTDWDYNWMGLLAVTLVCAITATSYGLMIACLTRTSDQAHAFGSLSIVILSIVAGVMIPRFVMPAFMQELAKFSPLYWGLDSYLNLIARRASLASTLPNLGVLLAFSCLFSAIAFVRFRWSEANT